MVIAKRQSRGKPAKIEQRKFPGLTSLKQTGLLASPIYIGQAQGEEENIKRGAKIGLLFSSSLLGQPTLTP